MYCQLVSNSSVCSRWGRNGTQWLPKPWDWVLGCYDGAQCTRQGVVHLNIKHVGGHCAELRFIRKCNLLPLSTPKSVYVPQFQSGVKCQWKLQQEGGGPLTSTCLKILPIWSRGPTVDTVWRLYIQDYSWNCRMLMHGTVNVRNFCYNSWNNGRKNTRHGRKPNEILE